MRHIFIFVCYIILWAGIWREYGRTIEAKGEEFGRTIEADVRVGIREDHRSERGRTIEADGEEFGRTIEAEMEDYTKVLCNFTLLYYTI